MSSADNNVMIPLRDTNYVYNIVSQRVGNHTRENWDTTSKPDSLFDFHMPMVYRNYTNNPAHTMVNIKESMWTGTNIECKLFDMAIFPNSWDIRDYFYFGATTADNPSFSDVIEIPDAILDLSSMTAYIERADEAMVRYNSSSSSASSLSASSSTFFPYIFLVLIVTFCRWDTR
jgi:hypothetical protein